MHSINIKCASFIQNISICKAYHSMKATNVFKYKNNKISEVRYYETNNKICNTPSSLSVSDSAQTYSLL